MATVEPWLFFLVYVVYCDSISLHGRQSYILSYSNYQRTAAKERYSAHRLTSKVNETFTIVWDIKGTLVSCHPLRFRSCNREQQTNHKKYRLNENNVKVIWQKIVRKKKMPRHGSKFNLKRRLEFYGVLSCEVLFVPERNKMPPFRINDISITLLVATVEPWLFFLVYVVYCDSISLHGRQSYILSYSNYQRTAAKERYSAHRLTSKVNETFTIVWDIKGTLVSCHPLRFRSCNRYHERNGQQWFNRLS
ncbi:hypothetical protein TNCV_3886381 [Trichonephila clavipes]|nr:hypothetical protein TNCV_3886381 [Trichonephila clavipes]